MNPLVPSTAFQAIIKYLAARRPLNDQSRPALNNGRPWKETRPSAGGILRNCAAVWHDAVSSTSARVALLQVTTHRGDLVELPPALLPRQLQLVVVCGEGKLHRYSGDQLVSTHSAKQAPEFRFTPGQTLRSDDGVLLAFEL